MPNEAMPHMWQEIDLDYELKNQINKKKDIGTTMRALTVEHIVKEIFRTYKNLYRWLHRFRSSRYRNPWGRAKIKPKNPTR